MLAMYMQRMHNNNLGPVARSLVSANRWLRGIKMYRFPWYLTLVSTNHASSNPGLEIRFVGSSCRPQKLHWIRPRAGGWCDCSGVSRGGAQGDRPPPLFLDQTEAQRAEKKFLATGPPPYLRIWITGPPLF